MQTTPVVKVLAAWVLVVLLIGAGFIAVVAIMNARLYSPEHRVDRYLGALQEGEGAQALGLLNATVPEGVDPRLLDGDALRAASDPLEHLEVQDAHDTGPDRVDVPVTFRLDGADHTALFPLEHTGTDWGVFEVWEFERTTLPSVEVSARRARDIAVNGIEIGLQDGRIALASFYPAAVTAQVEGTFLTSPGQQSLVLGPDGPPASLALSAEATPELTRAVDEQVHTFLDSCADQAVFQPTGCPFTYLTTEPLAGDIVWTIEDYPTITVQENDDAWSLSTLQGSARMETTLQDYLSGAETDISESVPFEFDADLRVTDDDVTVVPDISY